MSPAPDPTPFETSVDALASLLAQRHLISGATLADPSPEKRLQAIHDLLLEKDVLHDEEVMLKCAELRQEMTAAGAPRPRIPSLESLVLERALRELLTAKGLWR